MKKIKTYNIFMENRINDYTDEILDKISKHGIDSLTPEEREFLDSHKSGEQEETLDKIENVFSEKFNGVEVSFKYIGSELMDDGYYTHKGIMTINGIDISGDMAEYHGGVMTDFEDEDYNDWTLVQGHEYEYEQFLEIILGELDKNPKLL